MYANYMGGPQITISQGSSPRDGALSGKAKLMIDPEQE